MVIAIFIGQLERFEQREPVVDQGTVALEFCVFAKAYYTVVAEPPGEGVKSYPQPGAGEEAGQQAYHLALAVDHHVIVFAADSQQQVLHVTPVIAPGFLDDDESIDIGIALRHTRAIIHDQIVNFPGWIVLLEVVAQRGGDQHIPYLFGLYYKVFHKAGLNRGHC